MRSPAERAASVRVETREELGALKTLTRGGVPVGPRLSRPSTRARKDLSARAPVGLAPPVSGGLSGRRTGSVPSKEREESTEGIPRRSPRVDVGHEIHVDQVQRKEGGAQ
jgi:hypothetical protein